MASEALKIVGAQFKIDGLKRAEDELRRVDRRVDDTARGLRRYDRDTGAAAAANARFGMTLAGLQGPLGLARKGVNSLSNAALRYSKLALTVGTGATLAFGASAIKSGIDFEEGFAGVLKVTEGLGSTLDSLTPKGELVRQQFLNLSKEVPVVIEDLLRFGAIGGQLGVDESGIAAFAETIARMSVSFDGISTEEAALQVSRLDSVLNESRGDYERIGSAVTALGNNFATLEGPILSNAQNLTALKIQLGLGVPDVLAWGAAIEAVGGEPQAMGSALTKMSVKMKEAVLTGNENLSFFAETAGMTSSAFQKAFKDDAQGALIAFVAGLENMDKQGKISSQVLDELELGDIRLIREVSKLGLGLDTLTSAIETSNDAYRKNTALVEESEKRFATLGSQFKFIQNATDRLGVAFSGLVRKDLQGLAGKTTSLVDEIEAAVAGETDIVSALRAAVNVAKESGVLEEMGETLGGLLAVGFSTSMDLLANSIPPIIRAVIGAAIGARFGLVGAGVGAFGGLVLPEITGSISDSILGPAPTITEQFETRARSALLPQDFKTLDEEQQSSLLKDIDNLTKNVGIEDAQNQLSASNASIGALANSDLLGPTSGIATGASLGIGAATLGVGALNAIGGLAAGAGAEGLFGAAAAGAAGLSGLGFLSGGALGGTAALLLQIQGDAAPEIQLLETLKSARGEGRAKRFNDPQLEANAAAQVAENFQVFKGLFPDKFEEDSTQAQAFADAILAARRAGDDKLIQVLQDEFFVLSSIVNPAALETSIATVAQAQNININVQAPSGDINLNANLKAQLTPEQLGDIISDPRLIQSYREQSARLLSELIEQEVAKSQTGGN